MRRNCIIRGIELSALAGVLMLGGCAALGEATAAADTSNAAVETANAAKQTAIASAGAVEQAAVATLNTMENVVLHPAEALQSHPKPHPGPLIVDTPTCTIIKQNGQTVIVMKPYVGN